MLILEELVRPPRGAAARGGLQTDNCLLEEASDEMKPLHAPRQAHSGPRHRGPGGRVRVPRTRATISPGWPRGDEIALILTHGRRPLLGEGVPRGDVGTVLGETPPATWRC